MKISYKRLWVLLIQKDITKVALKRDVGISAGTMCKLNKGEEVALLSFCAFAITWTATLAIFVRL